MKRYLIEIDIPVHLEVHADDPEEAEKIGDERFAQIYEVVAALFKSQKDVSLGNRYDNTEVSEWD